MRTARTWSFGVAVSPAYSRPETSFGSSARVDTLSGLEARRPGKPNSFAASSARGPSTFTSRVLGLMRDPPKLCGQPYARAAEPIRHSRASPLTTFNVLNGSSLPSLATLSDPIIWLVSWVRAADMVAGTHNPYRVSPYAIRTSTSKSISFRPMSSETPVSAVTIASQP